MVVSTFVIAAVVFFAFGFGAGYIVGSIARAERRQAVRLGVAVVIVGIWAGSVAAGIFVPGYSTSIEIHAIMGSIVGYLYGIEHPISILYGDGDQPADPPEGDRDRDQRGDQDQDQDQSDDQGGGEGEDSPEPARPDQEGRD